MQLQNNIHVFKENPKLRFSKFSDDWGEKKLGDICDYKNGGSFENNVIQNGKYNLITLNSIDINGNLKQFHKTVNNADWYLQKGDLIMVLSDVAHGNFLGLVDIIQEDNKYVLNQRMGLLQKKDVDVDLHFLRTYINFSQRYFKRYGQGSSQQNLSKGDILKFRVKVPTILEQQKIGSFLSSVDKWIENLKLQKTLLEGYKKGIMQKIFSQEIRFKDENNKNFPEWEMKKMGDVTQNFSNRNGKLVKAKVYSVTNTNGFVLQTDHFDKVIAGNDLSGYKIIKKNDFAYNPARINIGSIAHFKEEIGIISSLYVCFTTTNELLDDFLTYVLQLARTKHVISSFGEGGVRIYLWYDLFARIKINVPSLKEQQKIVSFLLSIDNMIELKEMQVNQIILWKKGLMQQLFI